MVRSELLWHLFGREDRKDGWIRCQVKVKTRQLHDRWRWLWRWEIAEDQGWGGKSVVLFGLYRFNMHIRYPRVKVQLTVVSVSLELIGQMGIANIHPIVISL